MKTFISRKLIRSRGGSRFYMRFCLVIALIGTVVLVEALAQEPDPFIVLSLAGFGALFWLAASLVRRKERRNESAKPDELLRPMGS